MDSSGWSDAGADRPTASIRLQVITVGRETDADRVGPRGCLGVPRRGDDHAETPRPDTGSWELAAALQARRRRGGCPMSELPPPEDSALQITSIDPTAGPEAGRTRATV